MNPRRVLITNAYTWYNKGDAGIIIAMLISLRNLWPETKITVVSQTADVDNRHYDKFGGDVKSDFFSDILFSSRSRLRKILDISKRILRITIYLIFLKSGKDLGAILSPDNRRTIGGYLEADLVISAGGAFLNDNFGGVFLFHLFQIFVAVLLKKPTIICAQSIGPFKKSTYRLIAGTLLKKVDLITVRERISKEILDKMKVSSTVTADMIFCLSPQSERFSSTSLDKKTVPIIGITVREWFQSSYSYAKNYISVMSQFIDYLVEERGAKVVIVPQVIGLDDDRKISKVIYSNIKHREKVEVMFDDLSPFEIIRLIQRMDLFIGTRMHSNIYALISHVPTIAISYHFKTDGIMDMIGLREWVIPIETLDIESLMTKEKKAWNERKSLRNELVETMKIMRVRALLNVKLIERFWHNHNLNA